MFYSLTAPSTWIVSLLLTLSIACTDQTTKKEEAHSRMPGESAGSIDTVSADAAAQPSLPERAEESILEPGGEDVAEIPFLNVAEQPYATVSIDVDTASFTRAKQNLELGRPIAPSAIRIEEFINYFDYSYAEPAEGEPLSIAYEQVLSPWTEGHRLIRIGLKSQTVLDGSFNAGRNFVFLIDTSGSMNAPEKLPLLQRSLRTLIDSLLPTDTISIVTYAGRSAILLEGGDIASKEALVEAINGLTSSGGTNGAAGIRTAYELASRYYIEGGVNRVILASDGDFNVGVTSSDQLIEIAKSQAERSIYLTILGFGQSYGGDERMEKISNDVNGNYFFIDSDYEATRVLSEKVNSTLINVANDVKVQLEFNPRLVKAYRLIGYVNRKLNDEDFNNDAIDAGDLGSSHQVTYLVEYALQDQVDSFESSYDFPDGIDPLNYQTADGLSANAANDETGMLKIRYKPEGSTESLLLSQFLVPSDTAFDAASPATKLSVASASLAINLAGFVNPAVDYQNILNWLADPNIDPSNQDISILKSMVEQAQLVSP